MIPFHSILQIIVTLGLVLKCCGLTIKINIKPEEYGANLENIVTVGDPLKSRSEDLSAISIITNGSGLEVEEYTWNGQITSILQYVNAIAAKDETMSDSKFNSTPSDSVDLNFINFKTISKFPFNLQLIDEVSLSTRPSCTFNLSETNFVYNAPELLKMKGYTCESHYITSGSGYIVEFHRIPAPGKPPVLVMPGIFQSSRDYLVNCEGRTLVDKLSENDSFDIWLGNYRGSTYGRNHTYLDPSKHEFWDYVGDEMAQHDATAAIDYILAETGQAKLNWVGFSLGSTMMFALLSEYPEYNKKINAAIALAPAVCFGRTRSMLVRVASYYRHLIEVFVTTFFHGELVPPEMTKMMHVMLPKICRNEALTQAPGVCTLFLNLIDGKDPDQVNFSRLPLLAGGFPSPTTIKQIIQWLQWIVKPEFTKYDYGPAKNLLHYGSLKPPLYNLSQVTVPIIMFWGENDYITDKDDVHRLIKQLPNVEAAIRVKWKDWTHIDFLYGKDADILVYEPVTNVLNYKTNPKVMSMSYSSP